jgi:hypothetical protein
MYHVCQSVHARGGTHTTTTLSLRVSSIQNLAYRIRKRYIVSCVASTRQICFPTGADELPAIWPRGSSREGTLSKPRPCTLPTEGAGGILEPRTFTYRPACYLTKWPVAQWGRPFTKQCNLTYAGQWAGRIANRSIFVGQRDCWCFGRNISSTVCSCSTNKTRIFLFFFFFLGCQMVAALPPGVAAVVVVIPRRPDPFTVDREKSILGTELEELKLVARRGRRGDGECVENVTHGAVEA